MMKFLPFVVLVACFVALVGCGSEPEPQQGASANEKLSPIGPAGGVDGESTEGGEGASEDEPTEAGTPEGTPEEPEVSVSEPSTEETAKPATGSAVDLGAISIPIYENSKTKDGVKDETKMVGGETATVITRVTSDDFAKVQSFYKGKAKWTLITELDDLAIYEIQKGNTRELVGINVNEGATEIVITKIVKK